MIIRTKIDLNKDLTKTNWLKALRALCNGKGNKPLMEYRAMYDKISVVPGVVHYQERFVDEHKNIFTGEVTPAHTAIEMGIQVTCGEKLASGGLVKYWLTKHVNIYGDGRVECVKWKVNQSRSFKDIIEAMRAICYNDVFFSIEKIPV